MDITPLIPPGSQVIQSYSSGRFRIGGKIHETPVLVFPDKTIEWAVSAAVPTVEDFAPLIAMAGDLDVVLVGGMVPHPALRAALKAQGLSVDMMDTGAACRTWNVLLAEGRRVAAAILPAP